ncbi:MAG: PRC-barrel domain-containing protein, partial [Hyphomicrobiales bacterium]
TAAEEPDAATDDEADVAAGEEEEVPDVIPEQDTSEMLGSSLMGASVNLADEEIGNVSDLIIDQDNQVRGVVVGVGGFLGIGEKRVALPVERLNIQTTDPGEVEISTDMTREELEEKEAFRTAAEIRQEEEAAEAEQQQQQQTLE